MFSFFGGFIDSILSFIISLFWFVITLPIKIFSLAWSIVAGTVGFILGLLLKPFLAIWLFFFPAASNELSASAPPENQPPAIVQVEKSTEQRPTQEVQLKPIELKVIDYATPSEYLPTNQISVEVILTANSGVHSVSYEKFTLVDSDGVKYPADPIIFNNHSSISAQTIREGEKAKGWLGFSEANCRGKCTVYYKDGLFDTYKVSFY